MLLEFLDKYQIPYDLHKKGKSRGGWVQVQSCPFCGASGYHLGIQLDAQRAACWQCGGKNTAKTLKELTDAPWPEILAITKQGFQIEKAEPKYGKYAPPTNTQDLLPMHCKYLKKRKLSPEYCQSVWGLKGTDAVSSLPFRVVIPIRKRLGNTFKDISWTARSIDPACELRYITAANHEKEGDEKQMLYGAEHARQTAIIVEGPFGVMRLGKGTVATLGLNYTPKQLLLMSEYSRRIVCFDNEPAAQARAAKLCEQLSMLPGETTQVCLDAADPGVASDIEREQIRRFAFGRVEEW